jgi:hypothetical protein
MNGGSVPRKGRSIRGDEDHLSGIGPEYEPRHLGCYEFFGFLRQFADLAPYPDAHRHRLFSKSGRGQPHSRTLPRNRMPFRVPTGFGVRLSSAAFPLELSNNLRVFIKFPDNLSPTPLILTRMGSAGASPHRAGQGPRQVDLIIGLGVRVGRAGESALRIRDDLLGCQRASFHVRRPPDRRRRGVGSAASEGAASRRPSRLRRFPMN